MRILPRTDRRLRRALVTLVAAALGALITYLLLDRNHAEELGGGSRAVAEFLRGQHPLNMTMWLALGAALGLCALVWTLPRLPARARV